MNIIGKTSAAASNRALLRGGTPPSEGHSRFPVGGGRVSSMCVRSEVRMDPMVVGINCFTNFSFHLGISWDSDFFWLFHLHINGLYIGVI